MPKKLEGLFQLDVSNYQIKDLVNKMKKNKESYARNFSKKKGSIYQVNQYGLCTPCAHNSNRIVGSFCDINSEDEPVGFNFWIKNNWVCEYKYHGRKSGKTIKEEILKSKIQEIINNCISIVLENKGYDSDEDPKYSGYMFYKNKWTPRKITPKTFEHFIKLNGLDLLTKEFYEFYMHHLYRFRIRLHKGNGVHPKISEREKVMENKNLPHAA